jgi:hypothetical protein
MASGERTGVGGDDGEEGESPGGEGGGSEVDEEEGLSRDRDDDEGTGTELDRPRREGVAPRTPRAPNMMMEGGNLCRGKYKTPLTADSRHSSTTAQQKRKDPTVPEQAEKDNHDGTTEEGSVYDTDWRKRKHANTSGGS